VASTRRNVAVSTSSAFAMHAMKLAKTPGAEDLDELVSRAATSILTRVH
jgi:hypothetical protein